TSFSRDWSSDVCSSDLMLQDEVEKNIQATGFLFDGFPRTIAQAEALDRFLESKDWSVTATVALEANDEVLIQRLLERGKTSGRQIGRASCRERVWMWVV